MPRGRGKLKSLNAWLKVSAYPLFPYMELLFPSDADVQIRLEARSNYVRWTFEKNRCYGLHLFVAENKSRDAILSGLESLDLDEAGDSQAESQPEARNRTTSARSSSQLPTLRSASTSTKRLLGP